MVALLAAVLGTPALYASSLVPLLALPAPFLEAPEAAVPDASHGPHSGGRDRARLSGRYSWGVADWHHRGRRCAGIHPLREHERGEVEGHTPGSVAVEVDRPTPSRRSWPSSSPPSTRPERSAASSTSCRRAAGSRRSSSTTAPPTAPATRLVPTAPRSSIRHDERGGVGAAIRDGWKEGLRRERKYLALLSGDDQHEPAELITALAALEPPAPTTSRAPAGGRAAASWARSAIAASAPASTRASSRVLALRRVTDATNGFRIFKAEILARPQDRPRPGLAHELRP